MSGLSRPWALRGWMALLTFSVCLALGSTSAAQGSNAGSMNDDTQSAKQHFALGLEAASRGEYEAAVDAFETAYKLKPHALALYNIAKSYDRLERWRDALRNYRRFLSSGVADRSPAEFRAAQLRVNQLVDELLLAADRTSTGNDDAEKRIAAKAKSSPPTSQLEISGAPANARTLIDGVIWTGPGPVAPGVHALRVEADGFQTWIGSVNLGPQEQHRVHVALSPLSSTQPGTPPDTSNLDSAVAIEQAQQRTLAYTLGATGVVLAGVSVGTYVWNQARFRDWEREDQALQRFSGETAVSEEVFIRRANNQALLGQVRSFRVLWATSAIAAAGLLGGAAYLLLSAEEGPVSAPPSSQLVVSSSGIAWAGTW